MRLPDPFTDTKAPGFYSVNLSSKSTILQDILPNSRVIQVDQNQHSWELEISYKDLTEEEALLLRNFIFKTRASNTTIDVLVPTVQNYKYKPNSLNIKVGLTGNTLILTGVTSEPTGLDYSTMVKVSSKPKIYQVIGHTYNSSTNELTLDIFPNLQNQTVVGDTASFSNLVFKTRLSDATSVDILFNPDEFIDELTLNLIESID